MTKRKQRQINITVNQLEHWRQLYIKYDYNCDGDSGHKWGTYRKHALKNVMELTDELINHLQNQREAL